MKKVLNEPDRVVEDMLEGFVAAYENTYKRTNGGRGVVLKHPTDKVGIVIGGGSGHEPLFLGYVGEGLADGAAIGHVFAAPTPKDICETARSVHTGKGILFLIVNYAGDSLNFGMAAELLEMEGIDTKVVAVCDDVASAPASNREERRGIAGFLFALKLAGAAAGLGHSLEEVERIAKKANDSIRSIGVALTPGTLPHTGNATFILPDDQIEFGMGIHGEPGVRRSPLMKADELTDHMMGYLLDDLPFQRGDEVCGLINGLGSTTMMELHIVNRRVSQILRDRGISVYDTEVGNFCTTQEMGGFSISLIKLDEELKALYDQPAYSAYFRKMAR